MIKSFSKQMQEEMDKIQMPKIKQLFMNSLVISDSEFKCTYSNAHFVTIIPVKIKLV